MIPVVAFIILFFFIGCLVVLRRRIGGTLFLVSTDVA
jgi:hypothetical protein